MRDIILYGELAKRFGKYHRYEVNNAGEALRALKANYPEFERYMSCAHLDGVGFRVFVGRNSLKGAAEVRNPSGKKDTIRLIPTIMGSNDKPWARVLVGAALITAGILITVGTFGIAAPGSLGMVGAGVALAAGTGLVIGGVSQLLTSAPVRPTIGGLDVSGGGDTKSSYLFGGPTNTSAQGRPVPVGYGRMIVGSSVISAGVETYDG